MYCYFKCLPGGDVRILVGGYTPSRFDPPLPTTARPHTAIMCAACGMGEIDRRPVDVIEDLARAAGSLPQGSIGDGWELDTELLSRLHDAASPDGSEYRLTRSLAEEN
jgi:hypothetical protein